MMTWSNNWISDDESIWSILMKFKLANEINNNYLKRSYASSLPTQYLFEDLFPYTINYHALSKELSLNLIQYYTSQIERWGLHNLDSMIFNNIIAKSFRYCTQCIKSCYHSTLHQLNIFEFCPYHRTEPLLNICKNCKAVLSLESVFSERGFYKCVCGNYLVENQNFFILKIKWQKTALMTFDHSLFLPNQLVFFNNKVSMRGKQNQFFDVLNCLAKVKLTRSTLEIEVTSEYTHTVYKAYLRRIRGQCKRKCLKSYYKMGRLAHLCSRCKCYLKLRYQFEDIKSEWDLFLTVKLKKEKLNIIDSTISSHKMILDKNLIETKKINLVPYILFYDLIITYHKLFGYINQNIYDENHLTAFILTSIDSKTILLSVHY